MHLYHQQLGSTGGAHPAEEAALAHSQPFRTPPRYACCPPEQSQQPNAQHAKLLAHIHTRTLKTPPRQAGLLPPQQRKQRVLQIAAGAHTHTWQHHPYMPVTRQQNQAITPLRAAACAHTHSQLLAHIHTRTINQSPRRSEPCCRHRHSPKQPVAHHA